MLGNTSMRAVAKPKVVLGVIVVMDIELRAFGEEAFVAVGGLDEADDAFTFLYYLFGLYTSILSRKPCYWLERHQTYLTSNDHIFQRRTPTIQRGCGVVAETFLDHLSCKARIVLELFEL